MIVSQFDEPVDYSAMLSGRVANLVPVDSIEKVTAAVTALTQTVGIYPESLKEQLRDRLPLFGAQRMTSLGYACSPSVAMPQDAIEPLRRMCKWILTRPVTPVKLSTMGRCGFAMNSSHAQFSRRSTAECVTEGIDLSGKVALITGVNSGLGFESMRVLALRGAHVIGAARTLEKAREACSLVEGKTTPVACDLADLHSVATCADSLLETKVTLDILMCNAGIMALPELIQQDGIELQLMTNHLGHFLLINRLLEQVIAADQGRVIMLSSAGHTYSVPAGIDFDNLSGDTGYNAWKFYGQSKLANLLTSNELARRLRGTRTTSNTVHPGHDQERPGALFQGDVREPSISFSQTHLDAILACRYAVLCGD